MFKFYLFVWIWQHVVLNKWSTVGSKIVGITEELQQCWIVEEDSGLITGHGALQPITEDADLRTEKVRVLVQKASERLSKWNAVRDAKILRKFSPWRRHQGGSSQHIRSPRTQYPAAHRCTQRGHQSHPDNKEKQTWEWVHWYCTYCWEIFCKFLYWLKFSACSL